MAIFEKTIQNKKFDQLLWKLENEIPASSWSAELEAGSDFKEGDARCSVRVFERYSVMGGNRLSLTLTMFQNGDSPIRLSAITAGGSQAVWGDRIFEKCGIRRDEEGDGGKTLEIRGKRRLSARDGGANYQQS